jgi:hypothetical protein
MQTFFLFATLISEYGVDIISAGLVREGFSIRPAGPLDHPKNLVAPASISCLGSWTLDIDEDAQISKLKGASTTTTASVVLECVQRVLIARKVPWHSLVVCRPETGSFAWVGSNFMLEKSALERLGGEDIG